MDHLSWIRVSIDDFVPTENVYIVDSTFIGQICLKSEEPLIDNKDGLSIDAPENQQLDLSPKKVTIDLQINVSCNPLDSESDSPRGRSLDWGCTR